jgi:hypothetical protein
MAGTGKQTFPSLLDSPLSCQDTTDWSVGRAICLAKETLSLRRNSARALSGEGKAISFHIDLLPH